VAVLVDDETLEHVWADPPGVPGVFNSVDHKRVGLRYIYTAFVFFFIAGLMALVMRVQLAAPNSHIVGPQAYNELFSMHGTLMIFLFNTPVLAGFGNYLLPLMLGTRDMAFPRLNAFSYWIFLFAGIFMCTSILIGHMPDGGWFAYVPLTGKASSPGIGMDFWGLGVVFVGISTTVGAVNFLVSVLKLRAPGMSVDRIPPFVWSMVAMAVMILFAVPSVTLAAGLLESDRLFGTKFFVAGAGGSSLLYQHLFWFWGHPEVYILFLPAVGMVSHFVTVFSRQRLAGYTWVITSFVAIAFISFGVWVHHMFATGMPVLAMSFFAAASLIIAIPNGVLYMAWIVTMWRGVLRFNTPMLFTIGFLLIFLLGGITGVMVAVLPFDLQAHDSYFVVGHFHYVLNGAVVFPIFGAIYYWWPKMTGRMLSERLGKISFWTMFVAFQLTFFPMHILGMLGMPRRIYTYADGLGWGTLNMVVSVGGFAFGVGTGITLLNVWWSRRRGALAPADPWGGDSLEWATSSPPPDWNFAQVPVVTGRHALWDAPQAAPGSDIYGPAGAAQRLTPITTGLDAQPESAFTVPAPTYLPVVAAAGLALFFIGLLVDTSLVLAVGVLVAVVAVARWTWRTEGIGGSRATGWWGMVLMIATEATLFAGLLSSYFYLRAISKGWPQGGIAAPELKTIIPFTVVLLGSSVPVVVAEAAVRRGRLRAARWWMLASFAMGAAFLVNQAVEYHGLHFGLRDNAYASLFYVITGLHGLHVLIGLAMSLVVQMKLWTRRITAERHLTLTVFGLYWHFVDAVWIFVFGSLYLSVRW
jgi:cytochrome c oxidase subunit I+III